MIDKDNSVNIDVRDPQSSPARAYHHGDLRAATIAEGLRLLSMSGEADLGLRLLARNLGVSATALYRHFPDKDALLAALAAEGLAQLGQMQKAAWMAAGGGKAGFLDTGLAYVRFAHDNPALFRLTFTGHALHKPGGSAEDSTAEAFRLLQRGIAAVLPPQWGEAQRADAALHAWSLVHGLAILVLDRRVPWDAARIRKIIAMTFALME